MDSMSQLDCAGWRERVYCLARGCTGGSAPVNVDSRGGLRLALRVLPTSELRLLAESVTSVTATIPSVRTELIKYVGNIIMQDQPSGTSTMERARVAVHNGTKRKRRYDGRRQSTEVGLGVPLFLTGCR
jgi:hypothetical protein